MTWKLPHGRYNMSVTSNFATLKARIHEYEKKYGRKENSVRLLGVSKLQAISKMQEAYQAGLTGFCENYIQEALVKLETLADLNIEWHFIGHIQSNKTKKIAEHFAWVHSVDSEKIAKRLNDQRPAHLPPLNICIEINVNHEKAKSGIDIEGLESLANFCQTLPRLRLRGLMAIPAATPAFEEQRQEFHVLNAAYQSLIKKGLALDTLSMGMSEDFEAAIAEGSSMVRIGTALFGPRPET